MCAVSSERRNTCCTSVTMATSLLDLAGRIRVRLFFLTRPQNQSVRASRSMSA